MAKKKTKKHVRVLKRRQKVTFVQLTSCQRDVLLRAARSTGLTPEEALKLVVSGALDAAAVLLEKGVL